MRGDPQAVPGPEPLPAPHPLRTGVLLGDHTPVQVREIRSDDDDALRAFHGRLSPESIVLRYFGPHPRLSDAEVERFTCVDGVDRFALVDEQAPRAGGASEIVAVARYDRAPGSDRAEVAFVVDDAHQGRGLGTILLRHLADAARCRGVRTLVADTLSENFRMLKVFRHGGFPHTFTRDSEVMHVIMDISPPA